MQPGTSKSPAIPFSGGRGTTCPNQEPKVGARRALVSQLSPNADCVSSPRQSPHRASEKATSDPEEGKLWVLATPRQHQLGRKECPFLSSPLSLHSPKVLKAGRGFSTSGNSLTLGDGIMVSSAKCGVYVTALLFLLPSPDLGTTLGQERNRMRMKAGVTIIYKQRDSIFSCNFLHPAVMGKSLPSLLHVSVPTQASGSRPSVPPSPWPGQV